MCVLKSCANSRVDREDATATLTHAPMNDISRVRRSILQSNISSRAQFSAILVRAVSINFYGRFSAHLLLWQWWRGPTDRYWQLSASLKVNVSSTCDLLIARRYVEYTRECAVQIRFLGLPRHVPVVRMMLRTREDLRNLAINKPNAMCGSAHVHHQWRAGDLCDCTRYDGTEGQLLFTEYAFQIASRRYMSEIWPSCTYIRHFWKLFKWTFKRWYNRYS